MFKSIGLGICCLSLGFAGNICRASVLPVDNYNDGNKCIKGDVKDCDIKGFDLKGCDLKLDLFNLDCHDIKPVVDCDKDHGKEICKIDWHKDLPPVLCDDHGQDGKDHCDLVIDPCHNYDICDNHNHGCDPAAVPAPSAAAFGGLGVVGIMLMAGLRSRRSAIC